ncbi:MAG: hypothetical protein PHH11_01465 [Methylomonas sp.]|nr:hypothetical protein [Methylomonas sp.]
MTRKKPSRRVRRHNNPDRHNPIVSRYLITNEPLTGLYDYVPRELEETLDRLYFQIADKPKSAIAELEALLTTAVSY